MSGPETREEMTFKALLIGTFNRRDELEICGPPQKKSCLTLHVCTFQNIPLIKLRKLKGAGDGVVLGMVWA